MISISRKGELTNNFKDCKIIIDNIFYGTLNCGEIKNIDISSGKHTIYLKVDWCKSNKLNFFITDKDTLKFECGNSMTGIRAIFSVFYITFFKNKYLWIREKNKYLFPNNKEYF